MKCGDAWSKRVKAMQLKWESMLTGCLAVPYDYPVIGYGTKNIGTLRLWQAEPVNTFDFQLFNDQKYDEASAEELA